MAIIHRIGLPENQSERQAVKRLAKGLSDNFVLFHNFEMTTGRGLPYEYDIMVLAPHGIYHVEVKGYQGKIHGNMLQWVFENGSVFPSPIPLANKKTKVLANKIRQYSHRLDQIFVDTMILLTDDHAHLHIKDDQANRVVHVREALNRMNDPSQLPVNPRELSQNYDIVQEAMSMTKPKSTLQRIGLYDVIEKIDQDDRFTIFLTSHHFIETEPKTLLKIYHLDVYATDEEKQYRIREIFHGQDAMRLLGTHPNLMRTGDMFAWNDDSFVEPMEFLETGQWLETVLDHESTLELTWQEKVRIIKGVAAGLSHVHHRGIIHRDVRPRNIMVSPDTVKLANFDLAYIPNAPNLSIASSVREHFDPRYVAPAVWLDPRDVAEASDIYSLGLVFYQLITGQPPRHAVEDVLGGKGIAIDIDLLKHKLSHSNSPEIIQDAAGVAEVIARMCAPERSERYSKLDQVLDDLEIVNA